MRVFKVNIFATELRLMGYLGCIFGRKIDNDVGSVFPIVVPIVLWWHFSLLNDLPTPPVAPLRCTTMDYDHHVNNRGKKLVWVSLSLLPHIHKE